MTEYFQSQAMPEKRPRILIHCQYVYGIGHFVRALELARALQRCFDVHLVSGGEPVPNCDIPDGVALTQLPALFMDEGTGTLRCIDSELNLDACWQLRLRMLEQLARDIQPDILITEHFPFGLLFESEVVALIGFVRQSNASARVVCSVRDIIDSESGGDRDAHVRALLERWFDLVLVHGDERVVSLKASFPQADEIAVPCLYTGYVTQPPVPRRPSKARPLLLGSIGGGRLGRELLSALVLAHRHIAHRWDHELVLFRGAFDKDDAAQTLGPDGVTAAGVRVQPFDRAAYRQLLAGACGVICMGGYNTVVEALSMSVPALVYKRQFLGNNREQALRAALLEKAERVRTFEQDDLDPARLASIVADHFQRRYLAVPDIDFNGADTTCRILQRLWAGEPADLIARRARLGA